MTVERDAMAVQRLQEMHEEGTLGMPEPWTNDRGEVQVPWDEDADGNVLACYLDIFGLNGRPIRESDSDSWRVKRLKRERAQVSS